MYSFNKTLFRREITRQAKNKFIDEAYTEAAAQFQADKEIMIKEAVEHPVSQEIAGGPQYNGPSAIDGAGNLFSFIGFNENEKPIDDLVNILRTNNFIRKRSLGARYGESEITYSFPIYGVSRFDFESNLPMPQWSGGSWVEKIETGIWGLGFYIFNLSGLATSRSGTGLQSKNKLREASFTPRSYLRPILKRFFAKYQ